MNRLSLILLQVKFIDDEAEVCVEEDEEEEEEEGGDGLGTYGLPFVLTRTQKLGNDSGGFLFDDPEELVLDGPPRPLVSATDSGCINQDEIINQEELEMYVKSLKRRAHESNRVGSSSTQDEALIPRRLELWMLPVPVHSFHVVLMIG